MIKNIADAVQRFARFIQHFVQLFTRDLSREEFSRLFGNETRGMYEFFQRHASPVEGDHNRFMRFVRFVWSLFVAFLKKLSPARRLMYGIALLLLLLAFLQEHQSSDFLYAFLIVNFLLALEMADRLMTRDELDVAREIQESLRPEIISDGTGYEIAAFAEPARNVGGDYYDVLRLKDDSLLVIIADVSGKGISAALYAAKVQTALQLFAETSHDVHDLLTMLDGHLRNRLKKNFFITISALRMMPNGNAQLCRAGHPPALCYVSKTNTCTSAQPKGIAVGLHSGGEHSFAESLEVENLHFGSGDLIMLFTDGVIESVNKMGNEFGQHRLELLMKTFPNDSASSLKDRVARELTSFREGADLRDDTTFVILKRL